jgi:pimeloyl-ACP methyl ester carboxylesterase
MELQRKSRESPIPSRKDLMSCEKVIRLQNGAHIALAEYGDPKGLPVIFCHGWPSSCTMAELTDNAAREVGVRIISPDRPGISGSALQPNRKLVDWPPIGREIVDHLGISEFRMLAISGGAPYAYATAWSMPERVRAIAVVSGAPPIVDLADQNGLLPLYRWMLTLHQKRPELLRKLFYAARPLASIRLPIRFRPMLLKLLQPCDAASLRDSAAFEACFESQRRAWRGSAEGVMMDARIYAEPWGFPLEEVRVPVRLWHGKEDRSFSFRVAEEMAKRLPNCTARYIDKAGHYSLPIRHMREILTDLIAVGRGD